MRLEWFQRISKLILRTWLIRTRSKCRFRARDTWWVELFPRMLGAHWSWLYIVAIHFSYSYMYTCVCVCVYIYNVCMHMCVYVMYFVCPFIIQFLQATQGTESFRNVGERGIRFFFFFFFFGKISSRMSFPYTLCHPKALSPFSFFLSLLLTLAFAVIFFPSRLPSHRILSV